MDTKKDSNTIFIRPASKPDILSHPEWWGTVAKIKNVYDDGMDHGEFMEICADVLSEEEYFDNSSRLLRYHEIWERWYESGKGEAFRKREVFRGDIESF